MPSARPLTTVLATALCLSALGAARAPAATFVPDDPGRSGLAGGWQRDQWNFAGPFGVDAPGAWRHLIAARRPGGAGVVVAVVDSGVAYRTRPPFGRSSDLHAFRFVRGHDFVDDDAFPDDETGHGTHVASTIAEATDNGVGLTGLAYGVRIMPVRVLDRDGTGEAADMARGIGWAVDHGADVVNVSFGFDARGRPEVTGALLRAVRDARARGVVVVAAAGNESLGVLELPARSRSVIAVGATTEHGCLADYSNVGSGLDLVAPGGGADAGLPGDARCDPTDDGLRDILQSTLGSRPGSVRADGRQGTSMAAAHVSAAAALVIASGVLGADPTPVAVQRRLQDTARDLGTPGHDAHYGSGLLDAAAATAPGAAARRPAPRPSG